jgi:hypothetical protein
LKAIYGIKILKLRDFLAHAKYILHYFVDGFFGCLWSLFPFLLRYGPALRYNIHWIIILCITYRRKKSKRNLVPLITVPRHSSMLHPAPSVSTLQQLYYLLAVTALVGPTRPCPTPFIDVLFTHSHCSVQSPRSAHCSCIYLGMYIVIH